MVLTTKVVDQMLRRIQAVQDPHVEYVMASACLGVSKINHLLRANGMELSSHSDVLEAFDNTQVKTLRRLFPGLSEDGEDQAMRGFRFGGLGLRSAKRTALPALR